MVSRIWLRTLFPFWAGWLVWGGVWMGVAHGEAFRILDQGAAATGQGTAFAAQADNPSAIHYNPAGMTQLPGIQVSLGTNLIGGNISFTNRSGTTVDGDFGGPLVNPPPSQVYVTANLADVGLTRLEPWTVGIGVNTPFGILVDYPTNSPFSSVLTRAALPLIDIKPTVAFKLNDYLSLGAGLDIHTFASFLGEGHAELRLIDSTGVLSALLGTPPGSMFEANATDTAVGFNASFLWTPFRNSDGNPLVNLAFVYRSRADLDLQGRLLVNGAPVAGASTTIELPQIVSGGIAVWPIRNQHREWKVEVDLDYADWTNFQNLNLTLSSGLTLPFPRNYGDAFVTMVGSEYKWLNPTWLPDWDVAVRGGYIRSESPIPTRTFEPAVPDSDYHALSVGLGLLCKASGSLLGILPCGDLGLKAVGLDLAYQVLLFQTRGISGNVNVNQAQMPPTSLLDGDWDTIIHVGALNLRMMF